MNFLDDLIVTIAHRFFRGLMALGAGFVYAQMIVLAFLLAAAGTVTVAVVLVAAKNALLGG